MLTAVQALNVVHEVPITVDRQHSSNVLPKSPPQEIQLPAAVFLYRDTPAASSCVEACAPDHSQGETQ